ncbi:unnamed protein product [Notodromas monacha]|uniref:Uncharacterized protein n=1 Tax=Notodromas monacha TaxID=399045 RepID=A0A7R9GDA9_9CRUS|nr:unnamed protein product [Notodromas monacha]CAG0918488.1 unnamed protein product [Notodromas monacha]
MVKLQGDAIPEDGDYSVGMSDGSSKAVSFSQDKPKRHLCKQVSIESPSALKRGSVDESVFTFDVPIPEDKPKRHLCKQVSIESPSALKRGSVDESVFTFDVPIPEVETNGARVICAGVCYRRRDSTVHRSNESEGSSSCILGFREAALFPGFEVAGIVDALGPDVEDNPHVRIGDRVILYPYDEVPHGYAEFLSVPSLDYLVPIPPELPLPVASMLPTGAL